MTATRVWLAFAVLLALACVPIFSTVLPPLFDYPNHLARMHLLAEGGNAYYAVHWGPLPNLAEDLLVPAFAGIMKLEIAAKLFLVAIFAAIAGGAVWLNRASTGTWRLWPLTGFLMLYSRTFLWGFLNYLAGIGIALCGAALWLELERSHWALRVAVSSAIAAACYICHIEAFAVYALIIAGMEALPALAEFRAGNAAGLVRRACVALPQFIVPAVLFLEVWTPAAGSGVSYARFWRKADLLFTIFDNYHRTFDVACFAFLVLLLVWLVWRGRLQLAPRVGMAAAFVFAAYLLLPSQIFTGSGADHRLPVVVFLLFLAGSAPRFSSRAAAIWTGIALTALILVRLAVVEQVWLGADPVYTADLAALDALPMGAKVAVAFPPDAVDMSSIPETHLATLAVARREAFVPTLFAFPSQQPIAARPPFAALAEAVQPDDIWSVFINLDVVRREKLLPLLGQFDFIIFTARDVIRVPTDPCLTPVYTTPRFQIFRFTYAACSAG